MSNKRTMIGACIRRQLLTFRIEIIFIYYDLVYECNSVDIHICVISVFDMMVLLPEIIFIWNSVF